MNLLLDIGNSRIKWAVESSGSLKHHGSCAYRDRQTCPEAAWRQLPVPAAIWCASVADAASTEGLCRLAEGLWGIKPLPLLTSRRCRGVVNAYNEPGQLGVDRWAALIAAHHRWQTPLVVADVGSAMTVDLLDAAGRHLGGYIVPGLLLQRRLLLQGTAAVTPGETLAYSEEPGRSTAECVNHGVATALAALVGRNVQNLALQTGDTVTTVVTGGDAQAILPMLEGRAEYVADLVLQGMALMVKEQKD